MVQMPTNVQAARYENNFVKTYIGGHLFYKLQIFQHCGAVMGGQISTYTQQ